MDGSGDLNLNAVVWIDCSLHVPPVVPAAPEPRRDVTIVRDGSHEWAPFSGQIPLLAPILGSSEAVQEGSREQQRAYCRATVRVWGDLPLIAPLPCNSRSG